MLRRWVLLALLPSLLLAAVVLFTDHYGNARLGTDDVELGLSPSAVTSPNFGKICSYNVDGGVIAQPLYIPSVSGVTGQSGAVNLLVLATQHGSLYAFSADSCGSAIWRTNFGAVQAANSYPGLMGDLIYQRENGCKGTPAIDTAAAVIYAVCSTDTTWVLRKLNLKTGAQISSAEITGTVAGTTFCPLCQQNSAGVTLANGYSYVTFGSMADQTNHGSWYGWVFAYNSALSQVGSFCTTCARGGGGGGGIWQSGGGLSVDASGNLYAITGNGGGTPSANNLCLAVVKLSPTLNLIDWYAPSDYDTLNSNDWDMSTGRPMLIPGTSLLVFGAKDFNVYSLNTGCLGNIGGTHNSCTAPQKFVTGSASVSDHQGIYGCLYIPGLQKGYFPNTAGHIYAFALSGSTWNTTPVVSAGTYEFPGSQMVASCNGSSSCVIWGTMPVDTSALFVAQPAKLVAFNPTTLAEYWTSVTRSSDAVGTLPKLTVPTVANGKIYVGTLDSTVVVYGPNQINHLIISN